MNSILAFMAVTTLLAWAGVSRLQAEEPAAEPAAPKAVFADHFNNGKPTDSDTIPGFWHFDKNTATQVQEADNRLKITADGEGKVISVAVRSEVRPEFNFFTHRLTFHVAVQMTGTTPAKSQMMRFALTSQPDMMNYVCPDALAVRYDGEQNLSLAWKENAPGKTPDDPTVGHSLMQMRLPQPLKAFDLTLDRDNYTLVVHYGDDSKTFTGPHGIDQAQWGANIKSITPPAHDSAIEMETLRVFAEDPSTNTVTTWSNIVVSKAPKPANP
ncbi:MAG: hypothetical protein ACYC26_12030 [Phycisphaerales bacterium]